LIEWEKKREEEKSSLVPWRGSIRCGRNSGEKEFAPRGRNKSVSMKGVKKVLQKDGGEKLRRPGRLYILQGKRALESSTEGGHLKEKR